MTLTKTEKQRLRRKAKIKNTIPVPETASPHIRQPRGTTYSDAIIAYTLRPEVQEKLQRELYSHG